MSSTSIIITTIIVLLHSSLSYSSTSAHQKSIVMDLLHIHSIHSPFFNPNSSIEQLAADALERSNFRLKSLNPESDSGAIDNPIGGSVPNKDNIPSVFYTKLQVGEPAITQLLLVDTGSRFPWLYCSVNGTDERGLYYPFNSTDYSPIGCNDLRCIEGETPSPGCDYNGDVCLYGISYGDGSGSNGELVIDTMSFIDYPQEYATMTLFGCDSNQGNSDLYGGILGLGYGNISVTSQWGFTEFTYCFQNISNVHGEASSGRLLLGDSYLPREYETKLNISGSHYSVTIEGIEVNSQFNLPLQNPLSILLDTGASVTYLPPDIVVLIENHVKEVVGDSFRIIRNPNGLCYLATLWQIREITHFPLVTLKFSGNAAFDIFAENCFRLIQDSMVCMAILPSPVEVNVLGVIAQQGKAMTYDLEEEVLEFQDFECDKLRSW